MEVRSAANTDTQKPETTDDIGMMEEVVSTLENVTESISESIKTLWTSSEAATDVLLEQLLKGNQALQVKSIYEDAGINEAYQDSTVPGSGRVWFPLSGRYEVVRKAGAGTTAVVYILNRMTDENNKSLAHPKQYVFKCLLGTGAKEDSIMKQEISTYQDLPLHPNILTFYGLVALKAESQTISVMVMEYGGTPLIKMLKQHGSCLKSHPDLILACSDQLLRAVEHIQKHRIVHRDLNVENIMMIQESDHLDENGETDSKPCDDELEAQCPDLLTKPLSSKRWVVKVFDFGLAIRLEKLRSYESDGIYAWWFDRVQKVGAFLGNHVRPPEQGPLTSFTSYPLWAQDIWAVGTVCLQMVHGQQITNESWTGTNSPPAPDIEGTGDEKLKQFRQMFYDLIQQMVQVDPMSRISPSAARVLIRVMFGVESVFGQMDTRQALVDFIQSIRAHVQHKMIQHWLESCQDWEKLLAVKDQQRKLLDETLCLMCNANLRDKDISEEARRSTSALCRYMVESMIESDPVST